MRVAAGTVCWAAEKQLDVDERRTRRVYHKSKGDLSHGDGAISPSEPDRLIFS